MTSARVFALATDGTHLGVFALSGATAVDWEDMAIGPGPVAGQDYLYFADTGNNALNRSVVTVYRVAEPALDTFQLPVTTSIGGVAAFPMQYPSGTRRDAETLLVDPVSGDWLIVTRDRSRTGTSYVYLNPAPQQVGVLTTLQLVATLTSSIEIKGGDVSPAGDWLLLRTHSTSQAVSGLLWARTLGTDIESVFATSPCSAPLVFEPQGEAVAFAPDGEGYYTLGEGAHQPVYFYGAPAGPAAPTNVAAAALSSTQVRVTWTDAATNETGYRVERSTNGSSFTTIATLGAGSTTSTDASVVASTHVLVPRRRLQRGRVGELGRRLGHDPGGQQQAERTDRLERDRHLVESDHAPLDRHVVQRERLPHRTVDRRGQLHADRNGGCQRHRRHQLGVAVEPPLLLPGPGLQRRRQLGVLDRRVGAYVAMSGARRAGY